MRVVAVRTPRIVAGDDLDAILCDVLPPLLEGSVVAVTSKIVSLCEGKVVAAEADKLALVHEAAEQILDPKYSRYGIPLTITSGILIPAAGIDESNANGDYVLWPSDPQASAENIRGLLRRRDRLTTLGVVITDSTTHPLRRGATGISIAHSGFRGVHSYIGEPDLFGRAMQVSQSNIADALATAAVLVMGEGAEQTPLAIISELREVTFADDAVADEVRMPLDEDIYGPLLAALPWVDGGRARGR